MLVEHGADALGHTAADLAFDDGRVDDSPAVLDHEVAEDLDLPRVDVDLDEAQVGAARPPAAGDAFAGEDLGRLEDVSVPAGRVAGAR